MTECLRCGKCCMELGQDDMIVSREDVARWIDEDRWDILYLISPCMNVNWGHITNNYDSCGMLVLDTDKQCENCSGGDIINPKSQSSRCIFLRKIRNEPQYKCVIHETKPNHCRKWEVGKWKNCATLKGNQRK